MLLDPDVARDTKRAEVAEIWPAANTHFKQRHAVGIGRRGQAVTDVGGGDDCFTPEARRE